MLQKINADYRQWCALSFSFVTAIKSASIQWLFAIFVCMTKIQLSANEMQLVTDPSWILTKHRVIAKVYHLFGALSDQMQAFLAVNSSVLPAEIFQLPPKISKGEQYEALPYVVLDYPRLFSKVDVFAIRCFFWWGNYFSITWHIKGKFQRQYQEQIVAAIQTNQLPHHYCSMAGNEFNFDLNGKDYALTSAMGASGFSSIQDAPFLKISYRVAFEHWNTAQEQLMKAFQHFITIAAG